MADERDSPIVNIAAPRELANRLKRVAAHRGITMQQALEKYLGPVIDREYRKVIDAANSEFDAPVLGGEGG